MLLEYSDVLFVNSKSVWQDRIFGNNFHQLNHYFKTVSQGRFSLKEVDTIKIKLNKNHPNSGSGTTIHQDLRDALIGIDSLIDFSAYDKNSDKKIDTDELLILYVVAGKEDAFLPTTDPSVWAHQSCLYHGLEPILDAVELLQCGYGKYALFGERHSDGSYNKDATIGIIAHELSHAALDLPDLYDTSGNSAGIGYFGLMGGGFWGRSSHTDSFGNTPVMMSAWSRAVSGFVPIEVAQEVDQKSLLLHSTSMDEFNVTLLPINQSEYFLVENRATDGYDAGLRDVSGYSGGVAIWHIDESVIERSSRTNRVNYDKNKKGVDLEEAASPVLDADDTARGDGRNLFYKSNKDSFSPHSTPSSNNQDGSRSDIYVTDISAISNSMSLVATNPNKAP